MSEMYDEDQPWHSSYEELADLIEQLAATNEELEVKLRKSALQELSALGQASDAYQAQLAAEARIEELEAVLRDVDKWVDDLGLYTQRGHEPATVFKRVKEVLSSE